jgi:hypothetical protein
MAESSQIDGLISELAESSRRAEALRDSRPAAELLRRAGAKRWSAAECVEHLNLSNRAYLPRIDEALSTLREKRRAGGGPFRLEWNARLLKYWLEPPSRLRLPTGAPFQPIEVRDAAAAFGEFVALNLQLGTRLETARGFDLSAAKIASPFAEKMRYSVYSAFVLIAAHNRRHLWQAERALNEGGHA